MKMNIKAYNHQPARMWLVAGLFKTIQTQPNRQKWPPLKNPDAKKSGAICRRAEIHALLRERMRRTLRRSDRSTGEWSFITPDAKPETFGSTLSSARS
jgi:hypothetical protein